MSASSGPGGDLAVVVCADFGVRVENEPIQC